MTVAVLPEKTTKVTFKQDVAPWIPELQKLCTRGFTAERLLTGVLNAGLKNPQIFDCETKSIFLAVAKCARLALDPGEGIDLVPLNQTVKVRGQQRKILMLEAWTGYKGLKALAARQYIIRSMEETCVYEGDTFDFAKGLNEFLEHKPTSAGKRGELRGAYSIIRLPGGARTFHYLPIEDIEVIRSQSKQWSQEKVKRCPPWYAMKTVVRDYLNRQPQAGALAEALEMDDTEHTYAAVPERPELSDEELDAEIARRDAEDSGSECHDGDPDGA
jgi:phage RecT family recombinase